jgi:hypothetical protein
MLSDTELKPKTADTLNLDYEQYLLRGGRFPYQDFTFITETLLENSSIPFEERKCPNTSQILGICNLCGIQPSLEEIYVYKSLRTKMPTGQEILPSQPGIVNPWQMCDVELAREIFFLTDPTREKYQRITESFPHMFKA